MAELKIIKMSDIYPEPVEWLWEPYIPRGAITLMQGDGGEGKTTTALAIAAAVSTGSPLPRQVPLSSVTLGSHNLAIHADVIIQNAEDSYAKTIKPKLEQFGADCDMIHVIDEDELALSLTDERIEQAIIDTGAHLCILDPIQAYLGKANMNSAGGVRPLMKRLGAVAARHGCAVLLVGHLHKAGGKAAYRGLGSIDIYAAARSVLTVGRAPVDENMRVIVNNKNNLSPAGPPQAFGLDPSGGFCWLGDYDISIDELLSSVKPPESQFAKARRLIETVLAHGAVAAVDIMQAAEKQGISLKTLTRAKDALNVVSVKRGVKWYWELPVDVEYTVVEEDGQHGQDSQDGQDDAGQDGQDSPMTNMTTLTSLAILGGKAG
jgi:hypothetical protein